MDAGGRRPAEPFEATFEALPAAGVPTLDQVCRLITDLGASAVTLAAKMKTEPRWADGEVRLLTEAALETFGSARPVRPGPDPGLPTGGCSRAAGAAAPEVPRVALVEPQTWVPGSGWLAGLDPADYGPDGSAAPGCAVAARDLGAAWLSPADAMTSSDLVAAAGRAGQKTAVWTVNDPARMARAHRARGGRDRHRSPRTCSGRCWTAWATGCRSRIT